MSWHLVAVVASYVAATALTDAHFMGDTLGYADAILAGRLWEFGHVLWYPLGWLLSRPLLAVAPSDPRSTVILALVGINWVAGLLSVILVYRLGRRLSGSAAVGTFVAMALIVSHAFLNWTQTGSAYVPGLALTLLALTLLLDAEPLEVGGARASLAGVILALAVGIWFPYVLAVPAVLASPLLLAGASCLRVTVAAASGAAVAAAAIYGSIAASLGLLSVSGLREWIATSTHGVEGINGLPRMLFGVARSFVDMGNHGMIFKRFVVHDPFAPVSVLDLVGLSVWKIVLVYALIGAVVITLVRSGGGRRMLALLVLNAGPVITFALLWDAGASERYMPLYPLFFLSLGYALRGVPSARLARLATLAFVIGASVADASAMATPVLARRQERVVSQIRELQPRLRPASRVITVNQQDEVWSFTWSSPLHPANRTGTLTVYHLVEPGTTRAVTWRDQFAAEALATWEAGGDVWIRKRVLAARPRPEWNWVEGADPRLSWAGIHTFFSRLDVGQSIGDDDGFALLLSSPNNRALFIRLLDGSHDPIHARSADAALGPR